MPDWTCAADRWPAHAGCGGLIACGLCPDLAALLRTVGDDVIRGTDDVGPLEPDPLRPAER